MSAVETIVYEHPFLNTMQREHLETLCKHAWITDYEAGAILFREGEPATRFFLINSGEIAVECKSQKGEMIELERLGPGKVLGWSWLFPPFSWHFQARATQPTRTIVLDGGHLLTAAEENPEFGYQLMKRIAQIAIHRLESGRRKL